MRQLMSWLVEMSTETMIIKMNTSMLMKMIILMKRTIIGITTLNNGNIVLFNCCIMEYCD